MITSSLIKIVEHKNDHVFYESVRIYKKDLCYDLIKEIISLYKDKLICVQTNIVPQYVGYKVNIKVYEK